MQNVPGIIIVLSTVPVIILGACSTTSTTGSGTADDEDSSMVETPALRGSCQMGEKMGDFRVVLEEDFSLVTGQIDDGVVPATVLVNVGESGGCTLFQQQIPFCDPPCSSGTTCDRDGSCIPFPVPQDVGTVTITGLNKPVSMEPVFPGGTYFDTQVPHPVVDVGAAVTLVAEGGDVEGWTLYGAGVATLQILNEPWVLEDDKPMEITWAAGNDDNVRIEITLNIDQHGISPVTLICDVEDDGATMIPVEMVNALIGFGFSGFGVGDISRQTIDSVDSAFGCVEFVVVSHVKVEVSVEGHRACVATAECPEGFVCDVAVNTCVESGA